MNKRANRNIWIFIFIVIISGWIGVLVDSVLVSQPEGDSLGMGIWLIMPLLAAFIIIAFSKASRRGLGFKPYFRGNMKWYLISVLIFPVVTAIILLIGVLANWLDVSTFNFNSLIFAFCSTLFINFIKNIFEETAWRGYLTSQLLKFNLNDWKLYLVVGLVWCLWHLPYYLVFLPEADIRAVMPVSRAVYVVIAFTTYLSWTVMFTELFRVTKSVWPCVILHTVEDSLINVLVISGYIRIAAGREIFISPINGIITSMLYVAVGLGIRAYRRHANKIEGTQLNSVI